MARTPWTLATVSDRKIEAYIQDVDKDQTQQRCGEASIHRMPAYRLLRCQCGCAQGRTTVHRAHQAPCAAAPAAEAYAPPSDADVDDWIMNDAAFKESFERLEDSVKGTYQQIKITANTAEVIRLRKSR